MRKNNVPTIIVGGLGLALITLTVAAVYGNTPEPREQSITAIVQKPDTSENDAEPTSKTTSQQPNDEERLLYLIEEEKLAHDVYTVLNEKYDSRVFANILKSESTHQARVLTLLNEFNIPDPRSSKVGVFTNTELQELYNSLIKQGSENLTEAYKVGVLIEQKDIDDITAQLQTTTNQDIVTVLEALKSGSENHLNAFSKQL